MKQAFYCRFKSCTVHNIHLVDVSLRYWHPAAHPKGAARYLQPRGSLLPLVFVQVDATLYPAHGLLIESTQNDVARAQVFFHVKLQDLVENVVRWQRVLVFLIW